jgi:capsular polysaccharide biosynthesis protein
MEKEFKDEIEIDLRGLFFAILNKLLLIIFVGIVFGGLSFGYSNYFVDPMYTSTTQVYIVNKQNAEQAALTSSDIVFASYIAKDYEVLLTSGPVLQEVIDELGLRSTQAALASQVSVELLENTRIMKISVTSKNPKMAKAIADKIRDVANKKTKDVMGGIEAVNAVDEANLPFRPSSPNVKRNTLLGFMAGVLVSTAIVVIIFIVDDTIKTPDDIEKKLGISVLAAIPMKSDNSHSRKKNKKKKKNDENALPEENMEEGKE